MGRRFIFKREVVPDIRPNVRRSCLFKKILFGKTKCSRDVTVIVSVNSGGSR